VTGRRRLRPDRHEVRGYGRQKGKTEIYRGAEYEVKLLPKVKLEIAVADDRAEIIVAAIQAAANTGKIGDGKVFVQDLESACASAPAKRRRSYRRLIRFALRSLLPRSPR